MAVELSAHATAATATTGHSRPKYSRVTNPAPSITKNMPLGEIPKDDDVANACMFFCSDYSRMVTGETLLVNAGELLK